MSTIDLNNITWTENFGEKSAEIINLLKKDFVHEELISFLQSDDVEIKNVALLKMFYINTNEEASLVCSCLINHPTETREYASFLVNKLFKNIIYRQFFDMEKNIEIFYKTMFDVNPKICRNILDIFEFLEDKDKEKLINMFVLSIKELFFKTNEKNKQKNHFYDKFTFNLYWNLYALCMLFAHFKPTENQIEKIIEIIKNTIDYKEYTIREKGACLLNSLGMPQNHENNIKILQNCFLNDTNFYVKNAALKI